MAPRKQSPDEENQLPVSRELGSFVGAQAAPLPASQFTYKSAKSETVIHLDEMSAGMAYLRRLSVDRATAFHTLLRTATPESSTELTRLLADPDEKVDPYDEIWQQRLVEHLTPEGVDDPFGISAASG